MAVNRKQKPVGHQRYFKPNESTHNSEGNGGESERLRY